MGKGLLLAAVLLSTVFGRAWAGDVFVTINEKNEVLGIADQIEEGNILRFTNEELRAHGCSVALNGDEIRLIVGKTVIKSQSKIERILKSFAANAARRGDAAEALGKARMTRVP